MSNEIVTVYQPVYNVIVSTPGPQGADGGGGGGGGSVTLTGAVTGTGTGTVATSLGSFTSAQLRSALSDEVGTGAAYFVGGDLGTPAGATLTNATGLPVASGISGLASGVATFLGTPTSANLRAALTDESGTGAAYFQGGDLGTPSAGTLTNATGYTFANIASKPTTISGYGITDAVGKAPATTLANTITSSVGSIIPLTLKTADSTDTAIQLTNAANGSTDTWGIDSGLVLSGGITSPAYVTSGAGRNYSIQPPGTGTGSTTLTLPSAALSDWSVPSITSAGVVSWGTIQFGTLTYAATNTLMTVQSAVNAYNQLTVQNSAGGSACSANFIVAVANTTDTTNYGEFGRNDAGFTGSGAFNAGNATYVSSHGGPLALGTLTSHDIRFVINNGATDAATLDTTGRLRVAASVVPGYTNTATAGGTTTLTSASAQQQFFTGTANQTVTLPVASTMVLGQSFRIINNGTGTATLTINSSGANLVTSVYAGGEVVVTCILTSGTDAASWDAHHVGSDTQTFTAGGTWTKRPGMKWGRAICYPGGGGGGAGRQGDAASVRCGGGGGAPGAPMVRDYQASELAATETVTIGAGGTAGVAPAGGAAANGGGGGAGGNTDFSSGAKLCRGFGGGGGGGGTASAGTAGSQGGANTAAVNGVAASGTGGAGTQGTITLAGTSMAAGGASGGGITSANAQSAGGAYFTSSTHCLLYNVANNFTGGGTTGGGAGSAGVAGVGLLQTGGPGGGGGSNASGAGGNGGAGGFPGGAGGGGGASLTGSKAGDGGAGGAGVVYFITYF